MIPWIYNNQINAEENRQLVLSGTLKSVSRSHILTGLDKILGGWWHSFLLFVARIIWRPAVLGRTRDFGWLWNSLPSLAPRICLTVVWSPWWHIENQADAIIIPSEQEQEHSERRYFSAEYIIVSSIILYFSHFFIWAILFLFLFRWNYDPCYSTSLVQGFVDGRTF